MSIAVTELHRSDTKADLARAVSTARASVSDATLQDLLATVRAADALHAAAVGMLGSLRRNGGVERAAGMPAEFVLRLHGRAAGWDAKALAATADALAHMPATASALAGTPAQGRTRPRPRLLVSCDLKDLQDLGASQAARVLARVAGRPPRLSSIATGIMNCDPEVVAVIFDGATPVAVSDATTPLPGKVRTAIIARDGGCRFPGCRAPAGWSDVHHLIARTDPASTHDPANLVLLCRRCHDRVHRRRWRITQGPDGAIAFRYRGRTHTSLSRTRPPPRE